MFGKSRLYRRAFAEIGAVSARAASGDLSARIVHTQQYGALAGILVEYNRLLDLTGAFIRESGASLEFAAAGKYYRPFLLRGMQGSVRRGAEIINSAREAMKDKAEAAQRMEQEMAGQKAAMEAAARAQREKLAGDFEARVSAIVGTVAGAADTLTKNAEVMSGELGERKRVV